MLENRILGKSSYESSQRNSRYRLLHGAGTSSTRTMDTIGPKVVSVPDNRHLGRIRLWGQWWRGGVGCDDHTDRRFFEGFRSSYWRHRGNLLCQQRHAHRNRERIRWYRNRTPVRYVKRNHLVSS